MLLLLLLLQVHAMSAGPACSSLVQLLLQHGATAGNPNAAVDEDNPGLQGMTPLHLLACWHPRGVGSSSCKLAATGERELSAANRAAVVEQIAAATMLLEQQQPVEGGADIEGLDVNVPWLVWQETPLAIAAQAGAHDFAAWLISKGADVHVPRKLDTARPIDLAVYFGSTKVAFLLLEHGAEVSMSVTTWQQQQQPQEQEEQHIGCCWSIVPMIKTPGWFPV
jgi:hypothetical protein